MLNIFIYAGMYWIDPNGGHPSDAFSVHCDFDQGSCATCINMENVRPFSRNL